MSGMPTGIPTSIPTTIPTTLPTIVFIDDNVLDASEDDDNDLQRSIVVGVIMGSISLSYILYVSYQMFKIDIHNYLRRCYVRKTKTNNLARIMPV